MAKPTSPPGAVHANDQALDNIKDVLPPEWFGEHPPQGEHEHPEHVMNSTAVEHISDNALLHVPEWFIV